MLVPQSCPALCEPMACHLPGFSVHGIVQVRMLEWVAILFSRGSSPPRDWMWVSCFTGRLFTIWATREAPNIPIKNIINGGKRDVTKKKRWSSKRALKAELLRMEGIGYIEPMIFSSDGHNTGSVSNDGRSIFSLLVTGPLAMAPSISDLIGGQRY